MAKKPTPKAAKPTRTAPKSAAPRASGQAPDFASALSGLDDAWGDSRTKEPTARGFAPADVPDGDYIVQLVGARVGIYKTGKKKGTGYVKFRYQIVVGQYADETLTSSDDLSKTEVGSTGRTKLDLLSERLQRMGVETKKLDLRKLPELCTFLVDPTKNPDAKPFFRANVANNFVEGDNGEQLHFQNVYINEAVHPDDVAAMQAG